MLELLDTAEGGAHDDGDARRGGTQARPAAEIGAGGDQQRGRARADPGRHRGDLLDLTAAPDAQVVGGKALDGGQRVGAAEQTGPECVQVGTDRRDDAGGEDRDGLRTQRPRSTRRRS